MDSAKYNNNDEQDKVMYNEDSEDFEDNVTLNVSPDEYIKSRMIVMNYIDTYGVVILKNGMMIKIVRLFDYFKEMWNEYKRIESTGSDEELFDFLKNKTNGGVITNEEIDVDLSQIASVISEYRINNRLKEQIRHKRKFKKPLDNEIYEDEENEEDEEDEEGEEYDY